MTATSSCPSLTGNDDKVTETHHGVPSDVTRVRRSVGVVMMMVSGQALVRAESRDQAQGSGGTRSTLLQPGSRLQAHNTANNTLQRERGIKRKYVCIQIFQASDLPNKRKITTVWLQLETKESLITCRVLFISDASI